MDQATPYTTRASNARNDDCQTPLYEGTCLAVSKCSSVAQLIAQQRLRDKDVESCRDGTFEEIICCPQTVPLQARGQISSETSVGNRIELDEIAAPRTLSASANAAQLMPHYEHLAVLAYPNAAFDGHVHRCTAVSLAPQLLLTSAGCGRPSHAVFGVADMRDLDEDEDELVEITVRRQFTPPLPL